MPASSCLRGQKESRGRSIGIRATGCGACRSGLRRSRGPPRQRSEPSFAIWPHRTGIVHGGSPPGRPHSLLPSVAPGDRLRLSGCHFRLQAWAEARIVLSDFAVRGRALLFAAALRGFHGVRIGPPCFGCSRPSWRRGSSGALAGRASPGTRDGEFRVCGRCRRARRLMPRSARVHHSHREAHPHAPGRAGRR